MQRRPLTAAAAGEIERVKWQYEKDEVRTSDVAELPGRQTGLRPRWYSGHGFPGWYDSKGGRCEATQRSWRVGSDQQKGEEGEKRGG